MKMYIVHTLYDLDNNGMEPEVRVFAKQVNAIRFAKIEKDDLIKEVFKNEIPEVEEQESLDSEVVYSCVVQGCEDYWCVTVEKMSVQDGESPEDKETVSTLTDYQKTETHDECLGTLSVSADQDTHNKTVWARAGMSIHLTEKEIQQIRSDPSHFSSIMVTVLDEQRYEFDGESYLPREADENEILYEGSNIKGELEF